MYVYDCVIIMSFLLLRVISNGRPLVRNYGRMFVCVCALECVCVYGRVRSCVFCKRSSFGFRYLIDFIRAHGCKRVSVCV